MTDILAEGELFLGKYRIERLIGQGGMGAVYSAVDRDLARRVAIKVLLPHASSPKAASRFVNEGRAAARIESHHVARVFAAGRTESGIPYMILELLEGRDLEDLLQERTKLGIRFETSEAIDIVLEVLCAIVEAHHHGIVHRDLKPANLFLHHRADGTRIVKVLDFGISKASQPLADSPGQHSDLTTTRSLLGTPFYMSPEQVLDAKSVDHRTDIWSLGVILYEMLTGIMPFHGDTLPQLFSAIVRQPLLPLLQLRPDAPPELEAILARCLERDVRLRIGDASELSRLLEPFSSRQLPSQPPPPPTVQAPSRWGPADATSTATLTASMDGESARDAVLAAAPPVAPVIRNRPSFLFTFVIPIAFAAMVAVVSVVLFLRHRH